MTKTEQTRLEARRFKVSQQVAEGSRNVARTCRHFVILARPSTGGNDGTRPTARRASGTGPGRHIGRPEPSRGRASARHVPAAALPLQTGQDCGLSEAVDECAGGVQRQQFLASRDHHAICCGCEALDIHHGPVTESCRARHLHPGRSAGRGCAERRPAVRGPGPGSCRLRVSRSPVHQGG